MEQFDFVGTGWRFPIKVDARGALGWSSGPKRIQDSIWIILSTEAGERLMRPTFGAGVQSFVFRTNTPASRAALADAVKTALTRWEPRIALVGVQVDEVPGEPSQVLASIDYTIRTTNELFNMVFPFYVEEGVR